MKTKIKQIIIPIVTAAIWGSAFLAQGELSKNFPAFFINAARAGIAFFALLVIILLRDKFGIILKNKSGKVVEATPINKRKLIFGSLTCGVCLFIATNIQQFGIEGTLPSEAAFITTMYMIFVPIFSLFLGKKLGLNIWLAVVIAIIGLALICKIEGFNIDIYYVYLLISAVFFAVQIMLVDHYINHVDALKLSCGQFLVCSVLSIILSVCTETVNWSMISVAIFPLIYLGFFSSAIGYTLQIVSQRNGNPTVVTLILSLESVFALIFNIIVCLCMGQSIQETPLQFLGCALMLVAIFLSQMEFKRKK
ncbi:MAG: DMT family transporter [Clostridia bacterium]|nr:DMT family transporter [Clostridia bacterium]